MEKAPARKPGLLTRSITVNGSVDADVHENPAQAEFRLDPAVTVAAGDNAGADDAEANDADAKSAAMMSALGRRGARQCGDGDGGDRGERDEGLTEHGLVSFRVDVMSHPRIVSRVAPGSRFN